MPLVINTNVPSINSQRHLNINTAALNRSYERLASGYRINRAGDDAAGLQISERLRTQIRGSKKALDNVQDGMNFLNIADGSLQTITDNLQRMRELTVQAASDTYATAQRSAIISEINQLRQDIDRIARSTTFNGVVMLTSLTPSPFYIQVGPNSSNANDRIDISSALTDAQITVATSPLYLSAAATGTNFANNANIQVYISNLDSVIDGINTRRGDLGAYINRMEGAASNLQISIENQSASESRIRNVDVAAESADMTRNQILQQSSATILAQANQSPSLALKLLGNN